MLIIYSIFLNGTVIRQSQYEKRMPAEEFLTATNLKEDSTPNQCLYKNLGM